MKVRILDPDLLEREAPRLGATVRAVVGPIASIEVPVAALDALARIPGVASVRPARSYRPTLDISVPDAGAGIALSPPKPDGSGVIVGIVDTGVDWTHADFRDPNGRSRILAAWDQTFPAGGLGCPAAYGFGRCYSMADFNAALEGGPSISFGDGYGHGTHVAGIAAGNGLAAANGVLPGTYAGVAPAADLLIVKVFTDTGAYAGDLLAAFAWIEDQASSAGRPFVINLSLGTDLGPHDGTEPEEIALDALLAEGIPGRAAAVAAGNARNSGIHVEAASSPGLVNDHPFLIPSYTPLSGADNDAIFADLWYEGGDSMTVSVLDAAGNVLAAAARGASSGLRCTSAGGIVVDATNVADPDNGDSEVFISIGDDGRCVPATAPPPGQTLKVRVGGVAAPRGGVYHIWSEAYLGPNPTHITFAPATESTLVGSPATARRVVALGAYVTRSCWPDADPNTAGPSCFATSAPIGAAASYSSNGPTRDGRSKPEIAAPGEWIAAALTSSKPTLPSYRRTPDGFHWTLRGTSMASPHVAGALALMLQLNPALDAVQAREKIVEGARADGYTGSVPNLVFGGGKTTVSTSRDALLKFVGEAAVNAAGTLTWAAEPHSVTYNVYRGELPGSLPSSYGTCLAWGLSATSFDDPALPSPRTGFFYLITGVEDGVEGSLGSDSEGSLRRNLSPCP